MMTYLNYLKLDDSLTRSQHNTLDVTTYIINIMNGLILLESQSCRNIGMNENSIGVCRTLKHIIRYASTCI